mmetsp:Transcript_66987/g.139606  ORF Transcript_66987/g.139606 Transcript_66987/m.139606 type:complete len:292 (-) Transcript_66987:162-1037(-)
MTASMSAMMLMQFSQHGHGAATSSPVMVNAVHCGEVAALSMTTPTPLFACSVSPEAHALCTAARLATVQSSGATPSAHPSTKNCSSSMMPFISSILARMVSRLARTSLSRLNLGLTSVSTKPMALSLIPSIELSMSCLSNDGVWYKFTAPSTSKAPSCSSCANDANPTAEKERTASHEMKRQPNVKPISHVGISFRVKVLLQHASCPQGLQQHAQALQHRPQQNPQQQNIVMTGTTMIPKMQQYAKNVRYEHSSLLLLIIKQSAAKSGSSSEAFSTGPNPPSKPEYPPMLS